MNEELIGGLLVAAATGLTVLAYRHPEAYRKLYWPMIVIMIAGLAAAFFHDIGLKRAKWIFDEYLTRENFREATAKLEMKENFSPQILGLYVLVAGYLTFLDLLHLLIKKDVPEAKSDQ